MRICSNKISPIPKVPNDQTCDFPACACVFWSSITCSEFDSVPFAMQSTTDTDESVPVKNPRFHDSTENYSLLSTYHQFPSRLLWDLDCYHPCNPRPSGSATINTSGFPPFQISPLPGVLRPCGLDVTPSIQVAVTVELQYPSYTSTRLACSPRPSHLLPPASHTSLAPCP